MNKKTIFALAGVAVLLGAVALALTAAKPGKERSLSLRDSSMDGKADDFRWHTNVDMRGPGNMRGQGKGGMSGGQGQGKQMNRESCVADECLAVDGLEYPVAVLSDAAKDALTAALDDEYKAFATYQAVMARLGSVRPFSMIIRAEEQHISSLKALFDKYGIAVPENPYLSKVSAPETLQSACALGVEAEVANAALYRDTLLPAAAAYTDITSVFTHLMQASSDRHLPAFSRCD